MTIIALVIFGFFILIFVLIFRGRHDESVTRMMKQNHSVQPLFKERSAGMKYQELHETLKNDTDALHQLEELHTQYKDKHISVDDYHDALEALAEQHKQQ